MKLTWAVLGLSLAFGLFAKSAMASDNELYYAAEKPFLSNAKWEVRLAGGYDFSNPYLNVYSGTVGAFYLIDRSLSPGIEVSGFSSSKRGSAQELEDKFSQYNIKINAIAPQYSAAAVFRLTPISGVVNFFSSTTLMADIHILARAGIIQYETVDIGPMFGTGLELQMEMSSHWGFAAAILWDIEKPGGQSWQTRTGFRVGPSLRF